MARVQFELQPVNNPRQSNRDSSKTITTRSVNESVPVQIYGGPGIETVKVKAEPHLDPELYRNKFLRSERVTKIIYRMGLNMIRI